jgi:hypothetical protein
MISPIPTNRAFYYILTCFFAARISHDLLPDLERNAVPERRRVRFQEQRCFRISRLRNGCASPAKNLPLSLRASVFVDRPIARLNPTP